jgi:8-oxo-dGTP pyrophosphatase MutT (NUDIX family)
VNDAPGEQPPVARTGQPQRARRGAKGRAPVSAKAQGAMRTVRKAMSAGGVVYRLRDGHVEVILVARPSHNLWALPKGTPEPNESVQDTARREVREETGLEVAIVGEVGSIHYRYSIPSEGVLVQKVVHHFLMEPVGGDVTLHDHEYDVVDWLDIHEATSRMSYANERSIVEKAGALIATLAADAAGAPIEEASQ